MVWRKRIVRDSGVAGRGDLLAKDLSGIKFMEEVRIGLQKSRNFSTRGTLEKNRGPKVISRCF